MIKQTIYYYWIINGLLTHDSYINSKLLSTIYKNINTINKRKIYSPLYSEIQWNLYIFFYNMTILYKHHEKMEFLDEKYTNL